MRARAAVAMLAAGVAAGGCAVSPDAGPGADPAVQSRVVLEPGREKGWGKALARDWRRSLKGHGTRPVVRDDDARVLVRLPAGSLFEPHSAQLRPEALTACAGIAGGLARHPGGVLQVVVADGVDGDLEPAVRLAARRARSLEAGLLAAGVPAQRLRSEGRDAEPGDEASAWFVASPVIRDAAMGAWVPPTDLP